MRMKNLISIFLFIALVAISSSCEKIEGCTDENALNYDITAEVNKGCIYCDSNPPEQLNTFSDYMVETRTGTIASGDSVLFVQVEHERQEYEFQQCGQSGCSFSIIATNLTDFTIQNMQCNFEIPLQEVSANYFFQFNGNGPSIVLEPGQTKDITSSFFVQNPLNCFEMESSGFSFASIFSGTYIE